ncbi:MAG: type II secretion system minor pseudopilin GspH [Gammaproteobacteria bacterium]|nr:type II secretion system minor pseudopilin GspH [Gammaproteobacteria bacterium]
MFTRRKMSGFTLLELLVVVFIIGILSTLFTLSVGLTGSDRELETETDRLIAVVQLASDEAVMQGRELGMRFYPDGYEFATFQEDFVEYYDIDESDETEERDRSEWNVLSNEDLLGQRSLPEGILLELEIDGRSIVLDRHDANDRDDENDQDDENGNSERDYQPQIRLFSSGDVSPFLVHLRRTFENKGVQIEFDAQGMVEVTKDLE